MKESWQVYLSNFVEVLDPIASTVQSVSEPSRQYIKSKSGSSHLRINKIKEYSTQDLIFQLEEFKKKILHKLQSIDKPLQSIFFHNSSSLEKSFYPFTLFNIFVIGFILGKFPHYFHVYYTVMLIILMPIRIYTYYKTNNHYFLADLCYFVNLMCLGFIWIWPMSVHLYQTCFAFTFGSLSFAVITWRNSLVLHSVDKITSCFIHIMPPLTMYSITHAISNEYKLIRFPAASENFSKSWDLKYNIFYTSIYYLIWQSIYHYMITLRKRDKIKSGQRMTSFEYLTTHQLKNFWVTKLPHPWPMIFYTLFQYCYQLSTMMLCGIWFNYRYAASLFMMFIFLCAAKNGATYYIDHYGRKFEKEVTKLKVEVEELQQQLSNMTCFTSITHDLSESEIL